MFWLAAVREAYSRRIVGWKTSDRCDTDLVLGAFAYGVGSRDLAGGRLIHHWTPLRWSAGRPRDYLGFDGHPTTVYCRTNPDRVVPVQRVLRATANPAAPQEVAVSRPSDALTAQQAADATLTALLLGLGAVALLVGGIGVANTMVISVLERRGEVGLRRSLGATRGQIGLQFLTESLLLSLLGGGGGLLLGVAATGGYALTRGWPVLVPAPALAAGLGVTTLLGTLAGLYPATRAARLSPTEALQAA